jgi:hypothetical protein
MNESKHSALTLHIVLATVPQRQEKLFLRSIDRDYYVNYRNNSKSYCSKPDENYLYDKRDKEKEIPVLYNPLRYHILGNYDLAYISLIDNLKFAQRLFEPKLNTGDNKEPDVYAPYTFQSFTGITYHEDQKLKSFFYDYLRSGGRKKYFLGICNLKLNNAFLIGNGKDFLDSVYSVINRQINEFNNKAVKEDCIDYLILQSFSWFEFSVLLFSNNPDSISTIIRKLRSLSISHLTQKSKLAENSLYHELFKHIPLKDLMKANVFADTHTYVGIHCDLIEKNKNEQFVREFLAKEKKIKFKTEIEWQVKPGHMHLLVEMLQKKSKEYRLNFDFQSKYLLAGKSDYLLQEESESILTNIFLFRLMLDEPLLYDHVRKIRTRLLFRMDSKKIKSDGKQSLNLYKELKWLARKNRETAKLDEQMKALKISRQIRTKVLKIFTNYNNGIQDIILFTYFLDFKIFIDDLRDFINKEYTNWEDSCGTTGGSNLLLDNHEKERITVSELENKLMRRIEIFQEGFNVRMLNSYQFEDITDFDLDFNSSIQQLLSAYSSMIMEIGNVFYAEKYVYGPAVQLNLKDTLSSYISINYYIHHLTSPEFVFSTVTKEILNNDQYDTEIVKSMHAKYNSVKTELDISHPYVYAMVESELVDLNYFFIDTQRFVVSFDCDFKLYYFWFWTYVLQNPLIYDKSGIVNEEHFKKELFRMLLVAKYFDLDIQSEIYCPLPEIQTYWDRHFPKLSECVDEYIKFLNEKGILAEFTKYMFMRYEKFLEIFSEEPESLIEGTEEDAKKAAPLYNLSQKYRAVFNIDGFYQKEQKQRLYKAMNKNRLPTELRQWFFYMVDHLRLIYTCNNGNISFLRRDWKTGKPVRSFISSNIEQHLYSVDQTGGLFFDDMKQLNEYSKLSAYALTRLIHFSLVNKKKFVAFQLNKEKSNAKG